MELEPGSAKPCVVEDVRGLVRPCGTAERERSSLPPPLLHAPADAISAHEVSCLGERNKVLTRWWG